MCERWETCWDTATFPRNWGETHSCLSRELTSCLVSSHPSDRVWWKSRVFLEFYRHLHAPVAAGPRRDRVQLTSKHCGFPFFYPRSVTSTPVVMEDLVHVTYVPGHALQSVRNAAFEGFRNIPFQSSHGTNYQLCCIQEALGEYDAELRRSRKRKGEDVSIVLRFEINQVRLCSSGIETHNNNCFKSKTPFLLES